MEDNKALNKFKEICETLKRLITHKFTGVINVQIAFNKGGIRSFKIFDVKELNP